MSCRQGISALAFGGGMWDHQDSSPPPSDSFLRTFGKPRDRQLKCVRGEGASPFLCTPTTKKTLTTRYAPTTGGPLPPAETTAGSKGGDIFSLISFLSLGFSAHKGNVISLSASYTLWFCEIRHHVVETFCQVNINFWPHCANSNVMKFQSYHLL